MEVAGVGFQSRTSCALLPARLRRSRRILAPRARRLAARLRFDSRKHKQNGYRSGLISSR